MNVRFVGLAHGTAGQFDRAMPLEEPGIMIAAIVEYHAAFRSGFSGVYAATWRDLQSGASRSFGGRHRKNPLTQGS